MRFVRIANNGMGFEGEVHLQHVWEGPQPSSPNSTPHPPTNE